MNVTRISCVLLCFVVVGNFAEGAKWVEDLTRYIVEDSRARQVALITNLAENETTTSPIINEIWRILEGMIPISSINIEVNLNETNSSPPNNDFEDSFGIGSGATLFLLIHESFDKQPVLLSKRFINAVTNMATLHYNPKFLILFAGRKLNDGFEELLECAWTKKLLDLTIVEWIESERLRTLEPEDDRLDLPIIHQLNPFKNEYTKRKWTGSNIPLFPNKVDDMTGYPLRIRAVDSEPFTIAKFNERNEPTKIGGANMNLLYVIAKRMNATLTFLPAEFTANPKDITNVHDYMYYKGELQGMDLHSYLSTRSISAKYGSLRTAFIQVAEFCAVVPILSAPRTPVLTQLLSTYFLVIVIILIFVVITRVFRFTSPVWRTFNIANILIGVSEYRPPYKNVERIIFVTLIAVSCICSSSIYAAIMDLSLETTGEMEFNSIEDLDCSGLKPVISPFDFNLTFYEAKNFRENLMKKTHTDNENMMNCAQRTAVEKKLICLMDKARAKVAISRSKSAGKNTIKIANVRFWSDGVAFLTGKRCPYRSRIDAIIVRMHSVGLIDKLYTDAEFALITDNKAEDETESKDEQSMITLRKHLMTIATVGYIISLLTFIIEVVLYRESKFERLKQ